MAELTPLNRLRRVLAGATVTAASTATLVGLGTAHADEQPPSPTPAIIGGQPATENYPFVASLQATNSSGDPNGQRCGGALIHKDWVITAAHCVTTIGTSEEPGVPMDPALFHLRIGSNDRTTGGHVTKVTEIVVNPVYKHISGQGSAGDLALLHLDAAVPEATIPLATTVTKPDMPVRWIGWGYTSTEGGQLPTQLQQLDSTIIPPTTPKCQVDETGDGSWGYREGDVCVDNPEGVRGPCGGDSGSPLLRKVSGRWQLEAVDSRGVGDVCGESPDIGPSIGHHNAWITSVVG